MSSTNPFHKAASSGGQMKSHPDLPTLEARRRSNPKWRRIRRWGSGLVVLGFLGWWFATFAWSGIVEWILFNPSLAIRKVFVHTNGTLSAQRIQGWANVRVGDNLFFLDLDQVKRDLEWVPWIEAAGVERILPNTLSIRIKERIPVARTSWIVPNQADFGSRSVTVLMDQDGFVMLPVDTDSEADKYLDLPYLTSDRDVVFWPGRKVSDPTFLEALELLATYGASDLKDWVRIVSMDLSWPGTLKVRTHLGGEVWFGSGSDYALRMQRWKAIQLKGLDLGRGIEWMDLSVSNNIPVRWSSSGLGIAMRADSWGER